MRKADTRKETTGKVICDIFTFNLLRILHPLQLFSSRHSSKQKITDRKGVRVK